jgi:hypothetical protein
LKGSKWSKSLDRFVTHPDKLDRIRKLTHYYNQRQFMDAQKFAPVRLDTICNTSFSSESPSIIRSAKKSIKDWENRDKYLRTSIDLQKQSNDDMVHSLHDSILSSID